MPLRHILDSNAISELSHIEVLAAALYGLSDVIIIYLLGILQENMIFFLWPPGVCIWVYGSSFCFISYGLHLCKKKVFCQAFQKFV